MGRKSKKAIEEELIAEVEKEIEKVKEKPTVIAPMVIIPPRGYFRKFDQSLWVENLQKGLNILMDANIPVTGEYDDDTMLAVTQFETKYGGCANGMFDGHDLESYNKLRGVE